MTEREESRPGRSQLTASHGSGYSRWGQLRDCFESLGLNLSVIQASATGRRPATPAKFGGRTRFEGKGPGHGRLATATVYR